jgi:D-alanyl-lipoteichoic acid acyltransferase DltB (MBOAT superfamily)
MNGLVDLIQPGLLPDWMHPAWLHDLWIDYRVRYPGPPTEFLLVCFASLLVPGRWLRLFVLLASAGALYLYFGLFFAGGLVAGAVGLWGLTELLARWSVRRGSTGLPIFTGALAVHAGTVWLFWQRLPGVNYLTRAETMGKGELWLFCGIAFTVLRAVLYVRESCRQPEARRRLRDCLFYMLFFPVFRLGPIMGPAETLRAFDDCSRRRSRRLVGRGVAWFALGCAKLAICAYVIELYFQRFFPPGSRPLMAEFLAPATHAPWWQYWIGVFMFHLRIYCVMSGYTNLARGMCNIMGMSTPENFARYYRCTSLSEIWRRWHRTVGAWTRDLIYIPLGGNRRHPNLSRFVVFFYIGLWHFPYLNGLIYSVLNTLATSAERMLGPWWERQRAGRAPLYQACRRLALADGAVGTGLGVVYAVMMLSLLTTIVLDFDHGGIYVIRGLFGLQAPGR